MKAEELVNNFEDFYGPYTDKKRLIMISEIKKIVEKRSEQYLDYIFPVCLEHCSSRKHIPPDIHDLKKLERYVLRLQYEPYLKTIEKEDPNDPKAQPEVASKELIKILHHLQSLGEENGKHR